jgi:hypothetical protein
VGAASWTEALIQAEEEFMRIKIQVVLVTLITFGLAVAYSAVANESAEKKAVEAAGVWLKLVDIGEYSKSWASAAQLFKVAVTEQQWEQSMAGVRRPFGKLLSRELKSKQYATSLDGAPDGQFVVIQFEASFENKKAAIETVTPMLDSEGKWRVSGYYIK